MSADQVSVSTSALGGTSGRKPHIGQIRTVAESQSDDVRT